MRVHVVATQEEFDRAAAEVVCASVRERPASALGMPTGQTPVGLYAELARRVRAGEADLSVATVFAIDELSGVPSGHPATNASYLSERLTFPVRAVHVLDSEAADAEAECARFLRLIDGAGGLELAVIGIGTNGHIAFNEPGSPFDSRARCVPLTEASRRAYAARFGSYEATPEYGLTLGITDIMSARRVLLLANGSAKAAIVAAALEGPVTDDVPASVLQRHGDLSVVLDREAAAGLRTRA